MHPTTRRPGLHLGGLGSTPSVNHQQSDSLSPPSSPSSTVSSTTSIVTAGPSGIDRPVRMNRPESDNLDRQNSNDYEEIRVMTPEMRYAALKKLSKGHPPSSIGTIMPSPHPEYLKALFIGEPSNMTQFLKPDLSNIDASDVGVPQKVGEADNDFIIYLEEWKIDNIMQRVKAPSQSTNVPTATTVPDNDETEPFPALEDSEAAELKLAGWKMRVQVVQHRVARQLAGLQKAVWGWHLWDGVKADKEKEAYEVIVNDPLAVQAGAIQSKVEYWRQKLGWVDLDQPYWIDPHHVALNVPIFKFVAYGPKDPHTKPLPEPKGKWKSVDRNPPGNLGDDSKEKYIWSNASGLWQTPTALQLELEQVTHDRNAFLSRTLYKIQHEMQLDMQNDGVGHVWDQMNGIQTPMAPEDTWTGGKGAADQKETRRRQVKSRRRKQVPTRGMSTPAFVPEDGALQPHQALAQEASTLDHGERAQAQEEAEAARIANEASKEAKKAAAAEAAKEAAQKAVLGSKKKGSRVSKSKKTGSKKPAAAAATKKKVAAKKGATKKELVHVLPTIEEELAISPAAAAAQPPPPPAASASVPVPAPVAAAPVAAPAPVTTRATTPTPARKSARVAKRKATEEPSPEPLTRPTKKAKANDLPAARPTLKAATKSVGRRATGDRPSPEALVEKYPFLDSLVDDRAGWLEFLGAYGHHGAVEDSVGKFWGRQGALERQAEFLACLTGAVAQFDVLA